ncbi:hypothetical protein PUNSTDRAFT_129043 [Punctularia strigosozonata HHB-11173 SS5]|uniref:uncharacterized protein n=1 Tax=Punctularia strigosozonata (strain HHB-11173) TaxID=741275 RepID=UPI0004417AA8|nr:uncharacterized protein PUNSTDRAFT_129043 [Punctularia strigosozonata HHB-11173 SS5]EIN13355.1 hypothetical protein PUNSTDRAFT_129043 [Punctularia strigosozonata HHB-11173 SS5]
MPIVILFKTLLSLFLIISIWACLLILVALGSVYCTVSTIRTILLSMPRSGSESALLVRDKAAGPVRGYGVIPITGGAHTASSLSQWITTRYAGGEPSVRPEPLGLLGCTPGARLDDFQTRDRILRSAPAKDDLHPVSAHPSESRLISASASLPVYLFPESIDKLQLDDQLQQATPDRLRAHLITLARNHNSTVLASPPRSSNPGSGSTEYLPTRQVSQSRRVPLARRPVSLQVLHEHARVAGFQSLASPNPSMSPEMHAGVPRGPSRLPLRSFSLPASPLLADAQSTTTGETASTTSTTPRTECAVSVFLHDEYSIPREPYVEQKKRRLRPLSLASLHPISPPM